jgi:hypothetical protein
MLFEVESLYELTKLIVLSKSTEISHFFGGIFVTNKDNSIVYFTFSDSEKVNDFMNIYFSKDELVNGKFLKFPISCVSKRLMPVQGIEGPDVFIPLIYLHEDVDFNKCPKASPLVVKTKTFDDFLRSALGWPSLRAAFVIYTWKEKGENVYAMKFVQRIYNKMRRIYFTHLSDKEIVGNFIKYKATSSEEWKTCEDLLEPKWYYFPIVKLKDGFRELTSAL